MTNQIQNKSDFLFEFSPEGIESALKELEQVKHFSDSYIVEIVDECRRIRKAWKSFLKETDLVRKSNKHSRIIAIYYCLDCQFLDEISPTKCLVLGSQIRAIKICPECKSNIFAHVIREADLDFFLLGIEQELFDLGEKRGY